MKREINENALKMIASYGFVYPSASQLNKHPLYKHVYSLGQLPVSIKDTKEVVFVPISLSNDALEAWEDNFLTSHQNLTIQSDAIVAKESAKISKMLEEFNKLNSSKKCSCEIER